MVCSHCQKCSDLKILMSDEISKSISSESLFKIRHHKDDVNPSANWSVFRVPDFGDSEMLEVATTVATSIRAL